MKRVVRLACIAGIATVVFGVTASALASTSSSYRQINLVADQPGKAMITDPNLVNAWGLAAGPTTPLWVADNGTNRATIYPGGVGSHPISIAGLVVRIPGGAPTGQVYNPANAFMLHNKGVSGPARFIFDSEAGTITAWSPVVPPSTRAQTVATSPGAIYKGLAFAFVAPGEPFLYAADFHNARIDVYNRVFQRVRLTGSFTDPSLPDGYGPFNIQNIDGKLYVSYAKQDANREDEIAGPGLGFVDVYSATGVLMHRLISHGALNAPWGLVKAPTGFGQFSGDLLVGNFGNGMINAYDPNTGAWKGALRRPAGGPVVIDGLWGLRFGNDVTGGHHGLLFSAGPDDESHGLLGVLRLAS
jgi:uncharacterized protein (TIGR03118 family)